MSAPRLAYSANAYMRYSLDEAVARIAGLGYAGIELMADAPHLWPEEVMPQRIETLRTKLKQQHLAVSNINAFMMNRINDPRQPYWHPSWIEADRAYRQIRIDHTIRSLTLARRLGVPHISTAPGGPLADESQREPAMALFAEMLKPVLDHAEREGVKLLVEPEPGLLIENTAQFLDLRERLDSPMLGLNYDVGHFFCVGESPAGSIARLAGHIVHVHVEDIAATREHRHLVPGDGDIDFCDVFAALEGIGYDGWMTVELYPFVDDPDRAGRSAREHLLHVWARGRQ